MSSIFLAMSVVSVRDLCLYTSWITITSALKERSRRNTCLAFLGSASPFTFQVIILMGGGRYWGTYLLQEHLQQPPLVRRFCGLLYRLLPEYIYFLATDMPEFLLRGGC